MAYSPTRNPTLSGGGYSPTRDPELGAEQYTVTVNFEDRVYEDYTVTVPFEEQIFSFIRVFFEDRIYEDYTVTIPFEEQVYDAFIATVPFEDRIYEDYTLSVPFQEIISAIYTVSVSLQDRISERYTITVPFEEQINYVTYTVTVPLEDRVYEQHTVTVPLEDRIGAGSFGQLWRARVFIDGVDMTARLNGRIRVNRVAGAAAIASFTLMPNTGPIDVYDWIDKPIWIDYETFAPGWVLQSSDRIFTGVVDEPVFEPSTGQTEFVCTDGLQTQIEGKSRAMIDAEIGGYHDEAVFGQTDDLWEYARQRLDTVLADYDLDAHGSARLTSWVAKASPDVSFAAGDIVHGSLGVGLVKRRDVINAVDIKVSYRWGRKWQREIHGAWLPPTNFANYLADTYTLPNRDMVYGAMDTGWLIKSMAITKLPETGTYQGPNGDNIAWYISEENRNSLVWGMSFTASLKWLQDVTEVYDVRVQSDASIARHGVLAEQARYVIDQEIDEDFEAPAEEGGYASTGDSIASDTVTSIGYTPPDPSAQKINDQDSIVDPDSRADYENVMRTGIAKARHDILQSHRRNGVTLQCLLNPRLDLSLTGSSTPVSVAGQGKIDVLTHELDIDAGTAYSTVELAIYQPNVASQADDGVVLPTNADTAPSSAPGALNLTTHLGGRTTTKYSPDWDGYVGNYKYNRAFPSEWYPETFQINFPEVEDAIRGAAEFTANATLRVAVPQDALTINAA